MRTRVLGVLIFLAAAVVFAEGAVICRVGVGATAVDTFQPFTDGGTNCNWAQAATLALQCPALQVCYDPSARERQPDGGHSASATFWPLYDGGVVIDGGLLDDAGTNSAIYTNVGPVATANSICVDFTVNTDPYLLVLDGVERNISIIDVANGDGGVQGVCKIAKTTRKHQ